MKYRYELIGLVLRVGGNTGLGTKPNLQRHEYNPITSCQVCRIRHTRPSWVKNHKTLKKPKQELLDNALWMWFCQKRRKGTLICGSILKEKAILLHKKLKAESEFAACEGWIDRWKTRHGVQLVSISGEKLSADEEAAREFSLKFQEIVKENEMLSCLVHNIDEERGLNFKMLPTKMLAALSESVVGTKLMKDRITVTPCSNADGTHKLALFVIDKSKSLELLKTHLPCRFITAIENLLVGL